MDEASRAGRDRTRWNSLAIAVEIQRRLRDVWVIEEAELGDQQRIRNADKLPFSDRCAGNHQWKIGEICNVPTADEHRKARVRAWRSDRKCAGAGKLVTKSAVGVVQPQARVRFRAVQASTCRFDRLHDQSAR